VDPTTPVNPGGGSAFDYLFRRKRQGFDSGRFDFAPTVQPPQRFDPGRFDLGPTKHPSEGVISGTISPAEGALGKERAENLKRFLRGEEQKPLIERQSYQGETSSSLIHHASYSGESQQTPMVTKFEQMLSYERRQTEILEFFYREYVNAKGGGAGGLVSKAAYTEGGLGGSGAGFGGQGFGSSG